MKRELTNHEIGYLLNVVNAEIRFSEILEDECSIHKEVKEVLINVKTGVIEADGDIMEYIDECLLQQET